MIVVDNGNTIQKSKSAVLLKSDNYGGSAGFARGIIFAMETGFTHILLNDDDAEVNPESIFRLMSFLRLLKDKEICIAGIMFDENNPNIVYESGSSVIRGRLEPYNRGLDLSKIDNIPTIMKENKILYSNWTLFCMPVSVPKNNGLPLPVFVREDDVEYGLRSKMKIITLPGFNVWHHTYPKRYSPVEHYYYVRNRLIALSCSQMIEKKFLKELFYEMIVEILSYRYEIAEAMISGMNDYLKGPDYAFSLCKHGIVIFDPIKKVDSESIKGMLIGSVNTSSSFKRKITINGLLLRPKGTILSEPSDVTLKNYYKAKIVIYNVGNNQVIVKKRNVKTIISQLFKLLSSMIRTRFCLKQIAKQYAEKRNYYSSEKYWKKLLKIEK